MKDRITLDTIKKIKEHGGFCRDTGVNQLEVRALPSGKIRWYLSHWHRGRSRRITIGDAEIISPSTAREKARKLLGELLDSTEKSRVRLSQVFSDYMNSPSRKIKENTKRSYRTYWLKVPDSIKELALCNISRSDIIKMHSDMHDSPVIANRSVTLVKILLNYAVDVGYIKYNPVSRIKLYRENPRSTVIEGSALGKLISLIEDMMQNENYNIGCSAVLLMLFTGQRVETCCSAKWSDINLEDRIWNIPDTKSNKPHKVYICSYMIDKLKLLPRYNQYVFGSAESANGYITAPRRLVDRLKKSLSIQINRHDLKRTFVSYAATVSKNLAILKHLAGHTKTGDVTLDVYAQANSNELREAYELTAEAMLREKQ